MEKRQQQFSISYFVAAFFLLLLFQNFFMSRHIQTLTYSEFKTLLRAGNIAHVTLGTEYLQGELRTAGLEGVLPQEKINQMVKTTGKRDETGLHPFAVVRINDPDLVRDLEAAKAPYTGKIESTWFTTLLSWVLPALIFFGLWSFLMRRMGPQQGLMSIGKSKAKVFMEKSTARPLKILRGLTRPRPSSKKWCNFCKTRRGTSAWGLTCPRGCYWWARQAPVRRC